MTGAIRKRRPQRGPWEQRKTFLKFFFLQKDPGLELKDIISVFGIGELRSHIQCMQSLIQIALLILDLAQGKILVLHLQQSAGLILLDARFNER